MYGGASIFDDSKLCELSSTMIPNNNWGSNFRFCKQNIVAVCPSGYTQVGTLSENNDIAGLALGQTQEDSIQDCQAQCESNEDCVAFMYGGASIFDDSKLCELSSTVIPDNDWGSNFRFCKKNLYIKHEKSQCYANFAPYDGDKLGNPIFNGGGFIGQMTGSECEAECTNPANVDEFGRPCVAFEHSSQNYDAVANCALAWACDYTEKWTGGASYIRAYTDLPSDYALAASDVCVSAVDVDGTLFDVFYTGMVDSTKLVHTSGSVTCNVNTPNRYSNWGCTPGDAGLAIRLLADDELTRKFPSSGTEDLTENTEVETWYKLEGHDSSSDSLTFNGPSQAILHRYRAVYADALPVWNSDHDNGGEVCFDVFMKAATAYVKHGHSQCFSNNAPFDGDRVDNPIFGTGGFIGEMTGAECEAQCNDPTNVDEHGRPCVAFEHAHQCYEAVANCALAWACDYTKEWSGGNVYSRAYRN